MNRGFTLYSEHKFTAEIEFKCEGKEDFLHKELLLLKAAWPSISWDIGIEVFCISSHSQPITEQSAAMFLDAVRRHEWWAGCSNQQLAEKEKNNVPQSK